MIDTAADDIGIASDSSTLPGIALGCATIASRLPFSHMRDLEWLILE